MLAFGTHFQSGSVDTPHDLLLSPRIHVTNSGITKRGLRDGRVRVGSRLRACSTAGGV